MPLQRARLAAHNGNRLVPAGGLALGALLFGLYGALLGSAPASPAILVASGLPAGAALALARRRYWAAGVDWQLVASCSLTAAASNLLYQLGFRWAPAAPVAALHMGVPLFAVLWLLQTGRRRPDRRDGGVVLLLGASTLLAGVFCTPQQWLGLGCALLSALMLTLMVYRAGQLDRAQDGTLHAGLTWMGASLLTAPLWPLWPVSGGLLAQAAAVGLLACGVGSLLEWWAWQHVNPVLAASVSLLEAPAVVGFALLLGGQLPGPGVLALTAVTMAAIWLEGSRPEHRARSG